VNHPNHAGHPRKHEKPNIDRGGGGGGLTTVFGTSKEIGTMWDRSSATRNQPQDKGLPTRWGTQGGMTKGGKAGGRGRIPSENTGGKFFSSWGWGENGKYDRELWLGVGFRCSKSGGFLIVKCGKNTR